MFNSPFIISYQFTIVIYTRALYTIVYDCIGVDRSCISINCQSHLFSPKQVVISGAKQTELQKLNTHLYRTLYMLQNIFFFY